MDGKGADDGAPAERREERRENRSLKFVKKQNGESKTKNKFDILKNILNKYIFIKKRKRNFFWLLLASTGSGKREQENISKVEIVEFVCFLIK